MSVLLSINKVSKHFGGITALHQVGFTVNRNQIKGLIGPNGAGKTTLFNLVTGIRQASSGDILFNNKAITDLPPNQIARNGITRTFQNVKLFSNLTVKENVMVGSHLHLKAGLAQTLLNLPAALREEVDAMSEAEKLLKFVGLWERADYEATMLPFGQQRLLEIGRALAVKPQLLLLDEPAAGLSAPERAELVKLIRAIRDLGVTVLLVEHDMGLVMQVCEEIVVLEYGVKIAEGTPQEIRNDRRVIAAYLGEEAG